MIYGREYGISDSHHANLVKNYLSKFDLAFKNPPPLAL